MAMSEHSDYTNQLINETSPYLLQHAHNPVNWYPWGPRRWRRRAARTSPSCSRWVTRPATGATSWRTSPSRIRRPPTLMNRLFVNIKVDREERPDIDKIYQTAHSLLTRRPRRLAADRVPDAGRPGAVLRRHLFPERAPARHAVLPAN